MAFASSLSSSTNSFFFNSSSQFPTPPTHPPTHLAFPHSPTSPPLLSLKTHLPAHFSPAKSTLFLDDHAQSSAFDALRVAFPSLGYANILFYKTANYNVQVVVDENEDDEALVNRFRREVLKAGVIQECKRRRFHETSRDKKKRKAREAARRNRFRRPYSKPTVDKKELRKKDDDFDWDEDNWEFTDESPYR